MTDQELYAATAAALYGEGWKSPLARELDVALKTVQRWGSGYSRVPPGVWRELKRLTAERAETLVGLERLLTDRQQPQSPTNPTV